VHAGRISETALRVAREIRGPGRKPTIIIHGVMPRSGTVYTGELLRLHPDLCAYPHEIWEMPFLKNTGDFLNAQQSFFTSYKDNIGKIEDNDFLPLFGASMIAYLYSHVPEGKRMLLKMPDVQYLNFFFSVFPYENMLLLLRDGRDVVNSTLNTWPERNFADECRRWHESANMILNFQRHSTNKNAGYLFVKYEQCISEPESFVRQACSCFDLDQSRYPFDKIKDIQVRGSSSVKNDGQVSWNPVDKPAGFSPVGQWREWPPEKKNIFKQIAGQTLLKAGYCENHDW